MTNSQKPKVLGIIPARFESSRLPRKMLKDLCGKPLIERTYERTKDAKSLDSLVIATDAQEIEDVARGFGASVIRSQKEHQNGSERVAEAATLFTEFTPDVVVVVWGDEPMYSAGLIDECVALYHKGDFDVVSAAFKISDPDLLGRDCVGTVVTDRNNRVMYISRSQIPYDYTNANTDYYHTTGILVGSLEFFKTYVSLPPSPLEKIEGVEQLRILENGYSLGVVRTDERNIGVNTQDEYDKVLEFFKARESQ